METPSSALPQIPNKTKFENNRSIETYDLRIILAKLEYHFEHDCFKACLPEEIIEEFNEVYTSFFEEMQNNDLILAKIALERLQIIIAVIYMYMGTNFSLLHAELPYLADIGYEITAVLDQL